MECLRQRPDARRHVRRIARRIIVWEQARLLESKVMCTREPDPPVTPDDPAEYQRFLDMAREVEANEDPDAVDRAFNAVIRAPAIRPQTRHQSRKRSSKSEAQ